MHPAAPPLRRLCLRLPRPNRDPCLYVHDATGICLLAYVDDTLISSRARPPPTAAASAAPPAKTPWYHDAHRILAQRQAPCSRSVFA